MKLFVVVASLVLAACFPGMIGGGPLTVGPASPRPNLMLAADKSPRARVILIGQPLPDQARPRARVARFDAHDRVHKLALATAERLCRQYRVSRAPRVIGRCNAS